MIFLALCETVGKILLISSLKRSFFCVFSRNISTGVAGAEFVTSTPSNILERPLARIPYFRHPFFQNYLIIWLNLCERHSHSRFCPHINHSPQRRNHVAVMRNAYPHFRSYLPRIGRHHLAPKQAQIAGLSPNFTVRFQVHHFDARCKGVSTCTRFLGLHRASSSLIPHHKAK